MNIIYAWLLAGFLFLIAEAAGLNGIGFLFAGLGAVTTGIAVSVGLIASDAQIPQFIVFFAATAISAAVLWKPMKRLHRKTGYKNIVGETAYVGSNGLTKHAGGEVTWSGTIMKAQLIKEAPVDTLTGGAQVTIVDVSGATLIVKPKD